MLWGSTIDPELADLYELPPDDKNILPPFDELSDHPISTTTNTYAKPTTFLTDHPTSTSSGVSTATGTPTADFGWFSDMGSLVSNQKWFFGAIALVILFAIGAGVFFWRRRVARLNRANYNIVAAEDASMAGAERHPLVSRGGARTKELYDAFGETSDDEDADEATQLRPGPHRRSEGLGFHSGFLDDDEPPTGGVRTGEYTDEPEPEPAKHDRERQRATSPSESGGSWEHAS